MGAMGFTRAELAEYRGRTVPDLIPEHLKLLFVGINPSLWTAATGSHFARPGNRFYPALHRAGIISHAFDAADGYRPEDLKELHQKGIGISNLVPEATARADELSTAQLRKAPERLHALVAAHAPAVVAVLGITAFRQATGNRKAQVGEQASPWEGTRLFVAPNPSGLNAHSSLADLAEAYRGIGLAAGVVG